MTEDILYLAAVADELAEFVRQTVPESETVQKYGGTLFTLRPEEKEGQFCGIFVHKKHVQLSFSNGAELTDPENLLLGSGKFRRHINVKSSADINFNQLEKLLIQASKL